ncbi:MAG: (Fe-S)-binding protein, partial [Proteobacteria bacterium]|nr:(Fe-S)-binding protein [Pseudomonadota bacterium]
MFRDSTTASDLVLPVSMADAMIDICNGCNICKKECAFLEAYGNPGTIAKNHRTDPDRWRAVSFECSLCGLCTAVCPRNLDPGAVFLDFRRQAVEKSQVDFSEYKGLLNYEKKGMSEKYSLYSLPENCDTIFFPGCTLTGTRFDTTLKTYAYLKKLIKNLGVVLDCCTKSSHDLGRQDYFNDMFFEMKSFLIKHNVKTVIVACPNCHKIFNTYGKEFKLQTVYDLLSQYGLDDNRTVSGSITL